MNSYSMTAKMAAKELGLSHRTVEHYLDNLKFKLRVNSKPELINKAVGSILQKNFDSRSD